MAGTRRPRQPGRRAQCHLREADTAAIVRSRVFVDVLAAAAQGAADLLIPVAEGRWSLAQVEGEPGELAANPAGFTRQAADITIFKSVGVVAQDLYAAWAVVTALDAEPEPAT